MISVIILTFNSEDSIGNTLRAAQCLSDDIHVVDSYSTDKTVQIVESFGAKVIQHEFLSYGEQRNWAIENLNLPHDWQLHLDSDEILSDSLIEEIKLLKLGSESNVDGYYIPRLIRFMGRDLRHGGLYPIFHMRLFKKGKGRCELRKYDQHFYISGSTGRLRNPFIDDHRMSLTEWVSRHNKWANAEVDEIISPRKDGVVGADLGSRDAVKHRRGLRHFYYRTPILVRPFLFFIYRYIFKLGFLDGKEGLIYLTLQSLWYRFLVDAKMYEKSLEKIND